MASKDVVRFAVVDGDTAVSAVWRIWRNGRDVYVTPRSLANVLKTSLHASGRFRHAFVTAETADRFRPGGADRAFHKWVRSPQQKPGGTLLCQVILPERGLQRQPTAVPLPPNVKRLERPGQGFMWVVAVVETEPLFGMRAADPERSRVLTEWRTDARTTIWIIANKVPLTAGLNEQLSAFESRLRFTGEATPEHKSGLRAMLVQETTDSVGRLVDFAIDVDRLIATQRIRERAYYLWLNKSGRNWPDPLSNWCEAEEYERIALSYRQIVAPQTDP